MKTKSKIRRVDVQVCIFTAIIVILSSSCVYYFNYTISYHNMLETLNERSMAIYKYVEQSIDKSTFDEINTPEDKQKECYQNAKHFLENVKKTTDVMYLYTAKKQPDGTLIYVIDGLNSDNQDFRDPGDKIEEEIIPDLNYALEDNILLPKDIKPTAWGDIFIAYFPVHQENEVIGVVGIEFNADSQSSTYRLLRFITPMIVIFTCFIATLLAFRLFRYISNPLFQDMANTDQLTGLKSRNSFEFDMGNLEKSNILNQVTLVSIDLNGLKKINDTYGHQEGDSYIKRASTILKQAVSNYENTVVYRVGGDEFMVILYENIIEDVQSNIQKLIVEDNKNHTIALSMAIGSAHFSQDMDSSIFHTYQRADLSMYQNKKNMKIKSV